MINTNRVFATGMVWLTLSLTAQGCAVPSLKPQPYRLSGSWRLVSAVSELPARASVSTGPLSATLRFATEPPRELTITETDSAMILSRGTQQPLLLYPHGRSKGQLRGRMDGHECRATWQGSVLVVEHLMESETRVTETYERSDDGRRLLVTVMLEDERLPRALSSLRLYGDT